MKNPIQIRSDATPRVSNSKYIAGGCVDGKVRIWDSLSGGCVRTFSGHSDAIQSLGVSSDKNFLVSGSLDWIVPSGYLRSQSSNEQNLLPPSTILK